LPTDSFSPALARLDPASRALLDLSLRRGMRPEEIGDLLGTDPESVIVAREAALEQLGAELGLDEKPDLDDLRGRLATLPSEAWTGQAEEPEAERPTLVVVEDEEPEHAQPERVKPERANAKPERRSRLPLLLALLAIAAVVLVILLATSGGSDEGSSDASNAPAPAPQSGSKPAAKKPSKPAEKPAKKPAPAPASPEVKLTSVTGEGGNATGTATLADGGKRLHLKVTGLPSGSYEVWLYDSVIDALSIGKANGTEVSLDVELPPSASHYRYIDVSREPADGNANHSGESVLRVPLVELSP
jgi:hypothetical protein